MDVATDTITIGTEIVGTDFVVSGLSFQPKVVITFWSGRTPVGQAEQDIRVGLGFFASTTGRSFTTQWDHANAIPTTDQLWTTGAATLLTVAGAVEGQLSIISLNSDGFTLRVFNAFDAGFLLGWIALGGADITNVEFVDFTLDTGVGTQNVATSFPLDTGIDDKAVIFFGGLVNNLGVAGVGGRLMLGAAAGDTPINAVSMVNSIDAADPSQTYSYSKLGECIAYSSADMALAARANVSAWLSTGFTINRTENTLASGSIRVSALVIKGGRFEIGSLTTRTNTTQLFESTNYLPRGLLLASCNAIESTADTPTAGAEFTVGVAASPTSRRSMGVISKDAQATSDCGAAFHNDNMYSNQSTATTIAIEGLMDLVSLDATPGFTWVMDDADPVPSFVWYLSFADAPSAVKNPQHYHAHIGGLI